MPLSLPALTASRCVPPLPLSARQVAIQPYSCRSETRPQAKFANIRSQKSAKMGHEDAVYLAKLAEQAERYEGKFAVSALAVATCALTPLCPQRWSRT